MNLTHQFSILGATVAAALLFATPAQAAVPTEALAKNSCLACHGLSNKIVGPGYSDVAAKYSGKKDAKATLSKHIKAGGVGNWGQIPMPAQANLPQADLDLIVDWLVKGAKQ